MTIAEVFRHITAKEKLRKIETQERASFDYILSTLVVKGFSIAMGSKESYPTIEQAYPGIFDEYLEEKEELLQQKKDELSILRFKQFAQSYNHKKYKEVSTKSE